MFYFHIHLRLWVYAAFVFNNIPGQDVANGHVFSTLLGVAVVTVRPGPVRTVAKAALANTSCGHVDC